MDELDKKMHMAIGRKIKSRRLNQRMTIDTLSSLSDSSKSMLSMVEAGQRVPSIRLLIRVSSALGISMSEMVAGIGDVHNAVFVAKKDQKIEVLPSELADGDVSFLAEMKWSQLSLNFYEYHITRIPENSAIFQHPGFWFVHILEGAIVFDLNGELHELQVGDTLAIDTNQSHSMVELLVAPTRMIGFQAWSETG